MVEWSPYPSGRHIRVVAITGFTVITEFRRDSNPSELHTLGLCTLGIVQSTSRITTLGGASEKCPYSQSVVIPKVSLYVLQLDETLLWA